MGHSYQVVTTIERRKLPVGLGGGNGREREGLDGRGKERLNGTTSLELTTKGCHGFRNRTCVYTRLFRLRHLL